MSIGRKIALAVLITFAGLLLAVAIIVPRLLDLDRYRPEVTASIERASGRSVQVGRLSLTVLPEVAVRADNVAVGNPPGFPQGHILEIERVYAELDASALLHHEIVLRSLEFEHPLLNLLVASDGRWNTEGPTRARVRRAVWMPAPTVSSKPIARVRLEHGRVRESNLFPSGLIAPASFAADGVTIELDDVDPEALGLNLAPLGLRSRSLAAPRATLIAAPFRPADSPANADIAAAPPPGPLAAHGTFSAKSAHFGAAEARDLKSGVELYGGGVFLRRFNLELAGGHVTGNLVWNSAAQPASYTAETALSGVDLARLLAGFPEARNKITGTLEGELRLTGLNLPSADPLANKEGAGRIIVRNGTLPTLQLNRNLMELMKSILKTQPASDGPSSFRSISADLEISDGQIHSRQVTILGNGMDIDVSGSLALAGAGRLHYQGVSKMTPRRNGFEGIVAGLLGSTVSADGRINVPFSITGTIDQPRFALKNSPLFH
jgi:uncharacterized protein involved in outer membrane biogenesis